MARARAARRRRQHVVAALAANVRIADRILVTDTGRIVETGTFDELVDVGGPFTELYKLQLG
ncbi:hypothetical protein [Embleya sp. NPDC001921]